MPRSSYRQMALRELERRSHRLKYHLFMNGSSSESGSSDDDSVTLPSLLPRDTRRRCDSNNESDSEDQDDIPPLFSRQGYDSDDDNSDDSDSDSDEEMHDTSGYDADSVESDDDLDFEELMFFQTKRRGRKSRYVSCKGIKFQMWWESSMVRSCSLHSCLRQMTRRTTVVENTHVVSVSHDSQ